MTPATKNEEQGSFIFIALEEELIDPIFGHELKLIEAYVASLLLDATGDIPMPMAKIIEKVAEVQEVTLSNRQVRTIIRCLRRDHAFPILSRRKAPPGYWWCRTSEEMEEFTKLWQSQYFDEIETLSIMVKKNYPRLAGQLRLSDITALKEEK